MRKLILLIFFILCGCSSKTFLICNYTDTNNIYGSSDIVDTLKFDNDVLIYYERLETVNINSSSKKNINYVYKIKKTEGKLFKSTIYHSKYKVFKNNNIVSLKLFLDIKSDTNLSSILIDTKLNYDEMYDRYLDYGYSCK